MSESINVVRKFIDEYQTGGNEAVGESISLAG